MSTELKSVTPESPATELPELTQDHVKGLDMALQYRDERLQSTYLCREVQSVVSALSSRTHGIYKIPEEVKVSREELRTLARGLELSDFPQVAAVVRGWLSSTPGDTEKP